MQLLAWAQQEQQDQEVSPETSWILTPGSQEFILPVRALCDQNFSHHLLCAKTLGLEDIYPINIFTALPLSAPLAAGELPAGSSHEYSPPWTWSASVFP